MPGRGQDHPANERAADRRETAGRGVEPQGFGPLRSRVLVLQQPQNLRVQCSGAETLKQPCRDDQPRLSGQTAHEAEEAEDGKPRNEQRPASQQVSEPAGRYKGDAKGQRVAGQDPLHLGGVRTKPGGHGGHGKNKNGLVQERDEPRPKARPRTARVGRRPLIWPVCPGSARSVSVAFESVAVHPISGL